MNKFLFLGLSIAGMLFISCKKPPTSSPTANIDSLNLAIVEFKLNQIEFEYLHFKSKIDYVDENGSQNFGVSGRIKKDSVIWLSITPGLGIEAVRCLIVKDSIFILDRIHNKLSTFGFEYINKNFGSDLKFDQIQAILLGNLAYPIKSNDKIINNPGEEFIVLNQKRTDYTIENKINPLLLKIAKLAISNQIENTYIGIEYNEFMPLDSFLFANKLNVQVNFTDEFQKAKKSTISITHNKVQIESKPLNFPFNVPKRFEDK